MTPNVSHPAPTTDDGPRVRAAHFTDFDVHEIWQAGTRFAVAIADIAHHYIGDPGMWDCYGSPPDELARLRDALDGMQRAIRESRADLVRVERRTRRRAARRAKGKGAR